jgi:thiol-disulfide isomerase/thioredoxin
MPAGARTLAILLVTLGGIAAGFLYYRSARHPDASLPAAASAAGPATTRARNPTSNAPEGTGPEGAVPDGPAPRAIPDFLPDLKLPDLAGQERSLRGFLGHPLIVNFWATWCAPCRREMPLLQRLVHAYRGEGLMIVGIAVDFRTAVADYVGRQPVDYPLLIGEDSGLAAAEQFGMQMVLPFSVFADASGRIIAVKVGELHREEADYILGTMRALAAGRLSLPDAQAAITQRLRELAIERAKSGVKDS